MSFAELIEKSRSESETLIMKNEALNNLIIDIANTILAYIPENYVIEEVLNGDKFKVAKVDVEYISYNGECIAEFKWFDRSTNLCKPTRRTIMNFLRNLDKILEKLIEVLRKENLDVDNLLNEVRLKLRV